MIAAWAGNAPGTDEKSTAAETGGLEKETLIVEVAIGIIIAVIVVGAAVALAIGLRKGRRSGSIWAVERGDQQTRSTARVVDVPDSAGETLRSNFRVLASDPEMDVTAPDMVALMNLASPFDDAFQNRVPDHVKKSLISGLPKENGVPKLAFKIADKGMIKLIPECFKTETARFDNRGPTEDLWDEKIKLADIDNPDRQAWLRDRLGFTLGGPHVLAGMGLAGAPVSSAA